MDAKEEVRARLSIEDVVGEYVQLKRAGRSFKGLSPFNPEKTPSFIVSPDKQIWHDFSSGRGGDIFSFIQEMEGVDFKGALEILARRAGIDLDQYKQAGHQSSNKQKERLYEINELACHFYQMQFTRSRRALEYVLKKRQFTKETALTWRLGYAPNTGSALVDFLRSKAYEDREIKLAGLTSQRSRGGLQDMFRGRLMIPLADAQGRVVGFTARLLEEGVDAPKYINTPATPLYDTGRHVFGLHLAKEAIRRTKFVVLSEGNLDVIASHQAGVKQVVATAGTALTESHLKTLNRFTGDIRLCFDADKAGVAATERSIPIAGKVGVNLQVITIPSGKDPDELIKQDVALWHAVIEKPQYAVDWLIDRYTERLDMSSAQGKRELSDVVLGTLRQLPDEVERDHYIAKLADILQVHKDALRAKLAETKETSRPLRRPTKHVQEKRPQDTADKQRTEEHLMALTLMQPPLRVYLYNLSSDIFDDERAQKMFNFLAEHPEFDGTNATLVQKMGDYGKILALVFETLYQDVEMPELHAEAARLAGKLVAQYVRNQKRTLVACLQDADEQTATQLLKQASELDELLRVSREGTADDTTATTG